MFQFRAAYAAMLSESNRLVCMWFLKVYSLSIERIFTDNESQAEVHSLRKLVAKYCTSDLCIRNYTMSWFNRLRLVRMRSKKYHL